MMEKTVEQTKKRNLEVPGKSYNTVLDTLAAILIIMVEQVSVSLGRI
jgi:hypothetical protein